MRGTTVKVVVRESLYGTQMCGDGRRHSDPVERAPAETGVYRTRFSSFDDVGVEVVSSVAAVEGVAEESLPALSHDVDPDALGALFAPKPDGESRLGGTIAFEYAGHEVVVSSDGWILASDEA